MIERRTLLVATTNQGKVREIQTALEKLPLQYIALNDTNIKERFAETGRTFLANARGKGLFYSRLWPDLTLAEDSGLEVRHLDGAPGIYSARYSGPAATDTKNNAKVLRLLEGVPDEERQARFVSCLVLAARGKVIKEIQADTEGFILHSPRGTRGFGYDPLFFYPPHGRSFAELSPQEKNEVSHRGKALTALKAFLLDYLPDLRDQDPS